jgi:hypothetical protein
LLVLLTALLVPASSAPPWLDLQLLWLMLLLLLQGLC